MTYIILRGESICRIIFSTMYSREQFSVVDRSAVSELMLLLSVHVVSLTIRQSECADISPVFELAKCGACVVRPTETELFTPYLSITKEWELTAMTQNRSKHHGISLLYAAVAMSLAMPDFAFDKGGLSMNTRSAGWKVGVLRARLSYYNLYRFCGLCW